jgi:hypothetical protein
MDTTIPRYKESELSGDEWRISAHVELKYKGIVVDSFGFRDVETAIRYLDGALLYKREGGPALKRPDFKDYCDQEGCSEKATVVYRRIKDYCRDGREGKVYEFNQYRTFCDRHKTRGDCALDDADRNYELVEL